jgi:hypothetical protein
VQHAVCVEKNYHQTEENVEEIGLVWVFHVHCILDPHQIFLNRIGYPLNSVFLNTELFSCKFCRSLLTLKEVLALEGKVTPPVSLLEIVQLDRVVAHLAREKEETRLVQLPFRLGVVQLIVDVLDGNAEVDRVVPEVRNQPDLSSLHHLALNEIKNTSSLP